MFGFVVFDEGCLFRMQGGRADLRGILPVKAEHVVDVGSQFPSYGSWEDVSMRYTSRRFRPQLPLELS